jgi:hypothetical protein
MKLVFWMVAAAMATVAGMCAVTVEWQAACTLLGLMCICSAVYFSCGE